MMQNLPTLETEYQAAKLRLQAAQQEKLEAAAEFLSARAALRQTLETLWASPCDCGALCAEEASEPGRQTSGASHAAAA